MSDELNVAELLESVEDQFTLDGRLKAQPGVTRAKVTEAMKLLEKAQTSRVASAQLAELLTSTDVGYSIAHIINVNMIPQLDKLRYSIDQIAGSRIVPDFRPVVLRGLIATDGVSGAGVDADGAASVVPEGSVYPHVTVTNSEESYYSVLRKRGFRADVTFEAVINDDLGMIADLPNQFNKTVIKTYEAEIFSALNSATQGLAGGTLIDGTTVAANAPVSALAIIQAAYEIENRLVNGAPIGQISKYNVLVAPGKKRLLNYDIEKFFNVVVIHDGSIDRAPDAAMRALMPNIEIIETPKLSGNDWFMLPAPGTTDRPVLELLSLKSYEQPEIRVRNEGGAGYIPGGTGLWSSYDTDAASFRLRMFTGAALWSDAYVVKVDI